MYMEWLERIKHSRCTVIGLGVSNMPLVELLLHHGATVSVRDQKSAEQLGEIASRLQSLGVRLFLGESYLDDMTEDILFRSPGVHPHTKQIQDAVSRGAILTSEMELFLDLTPARVIGITGSDGKTTTTTLTHLILKETFSARGEGTVYVGGNIGAPLLPHVFEMTERDVAVVELSSFQLYTVKRSCDRAAITNLSPNHLNWHTDMEDYIRAKTNIYAHPQNQMAVFNAENEETLALAKAHVGRVTFFSSSRTTVDEFDGFMKSGDCAVYVCDGVIRYWNGETETDYFSVEEILLPGRHNLENYLTAIALTADLADIEAVRSVARTFRGVEHRLEYVATVDGVSYYNSSIDSSPTRTAAALSALSQKPIVICGGYDKHIPFEPLAQALCARAKAVVLTGATADQIKSALDAVGCVLPVVKRADFTEAVNCARSLAQEGDTVLLSPACASFDAFPNFAARGEFFKSLVRQFQEKE